MMRVQIMIMMVSLLIPTVLLGGVQIFLAGRKNKWIGLIIPMCSFLAAVVMTASIASMGAFSISPYETSFGDETLDDVRIYIEANTDDSGAITAFRDLRVKNIGTGKTVYYPLEFDEQGNLVGGKEAMQYRRNIERLTKEEKGFFGKSLSKDEMRKLHVKEHFGEYAKVVMVCALYFVPTVIFLVIYFIMRKRAKRKFAARGLEKMMIDDL